jgi:uncharacterized protein YdgA (DUF945 family)
MASTLLAISSSALAADTKSPQFIDKQAATALAQAAKELRESQAGERNYVRQLDNYAKFEFSPELRPALKKIFGSERPFPLERVAGGAKGQVNYVGKLAPYTNKQQNGTDFSWTEMSANLSTDKAGRSLSSTVSWPSLVVTRPGATFSMVNMNMSSKQQRGADGVAYGNAQFKIGVITFRDTQPGSSESKEVVRLEDLEARSEVNRRGAMAEIGYRTSIKAIVAGKEQVDNTNFAIRLTSIPAKAMVELDNLARAQENSKLSQEQQTSLMLKNMADFGKRAAIAGATLVIDDISAAYRGNVASIKGRIGFQKVVEADFKDIAVLLKKLVARFDVRVPVALIKDVSRAVAAKTVNPSAPDADKQIAGGADAMSSMVVDKAISSGIAVIEKNELRSAIEIRNGKLIVNGKEVDVGTLMKALGVRTMPQTVPAPVSAPQRAPEVQPEPAAEQ